MHTSKRNKIIVAATAGVGALTLMAGNAFTAGGVYDQSGDGFVGGTVDQEVFGANITNVAYALGGDDTIDTVTLTFANNATPSYPDAPSTTVSAPSTIEGKAVTLVLKNNSTTVQTYSCTNISSATSTCSPNPTAASARAINKITITVQES